jgi:hypothetical protein
MIDAKKTFRYGTFRQWYSIEDYNLLIAERDLIAQALLSMTTVPEYSPSYPCWCDEGSGRDEPHDPRCLRNRTVLAA